MKVIPSFIERRLHQHPSLINIVDNIGWLLIDKLLRNCGNFVILAWIARHLGPNDFGVLSYSLAFVSIFAIFSSLGLQAIVVRDLVQAPQRRDEILGSTAALQLIGGAVAYALAIFTANYLIDDESPALVIVPLVGASLLFKFSDISIYWFQSIVKSKYIVAVQNAIFAASAILKICLLLTSADVLHFAAVALLESLATALLLLVTLNFRGQPLLNLRLNFRRCLQLIRDSWPLIISGAAVIIQARIDQVMIGQLLNNAGVAYYSIGLSVLEAATMTSMILHSSFTPALFTAHKKDQNLFMNRLEAFYKLNVVIAATIIIALVLLSPVLINTLYGAEYIQATSLLQLMILRLFFAHIGVARSIYMLAENMTKYSALSMAIGAALNIGLNFILIPTYGINGAAVSSLTSFFISIFVVDWIYPRARPNAKLVLKSTLTFWTIFLRKNKAFY